MLNNYIDSIKDDILASTCQLVQIPSVLSPSLDAKEPFGKDCAKALEYTLNLAKSLGFRTKNLDGYCGYIEFGKGEEMVGIIGHLDVVPVNQNWRFPPFSATIHDNKIYGRGTVDDKGPVIASLYAMKAVMEHCKVKKRVRLILGLDEENDWRCIKYYKQQEELPSIGFSPDADFPCIYAEKTLLHVHLTQNYSAQDIIKILDIDCGNNALNVVPKYCSVTLQIAPKLSMEKSTNFLKQYDLQIIKKENTLQVISTGRAAHSAHPDLGCNAISKLVIALYEFFKEFDIDLPLISYFYKYLHLEWNGKSLGINFEDESGKLTFNVSQFYLKNGILGISSDLRIPIHTSLSTIKEKIDTAFSHPNIDVNYDGEKSALYLPPHSPLITTLCQIFNEVCGLCEKPIAIGGATYARAFKNCVSFGPNLPNTKDMCHQVDEFISIDNLLLCCKIYAKAIEELANLP